MKPTHYVVTAYRWGQRNAHSFVVGAYDDLEQAKACAAAYMDYRGGKYACEVVLAGPWTENDDELSARQVHYVESPYFGACGDAGHFHAADMNKPPHPCSHKPFTVRELQSRIWTLEQVLKQTRGHISDGYIDEMVATVLAN